MISRFLAAAAVMVGAAVPLVPLAGAPTASAVNCTVTVRLSPGTTNAAVKCLEQRLVELGYHRRGFNIGTPDSFYGSETARAVKYFQTARGLYADGLITSITGRQLGLRGALPLVGTTKVTVLGDSTSAAMRWYDEARNETAIYDVMGTSYDLAWSVESCKRLVAYSCTGRVDPGTGRRWTPVSVLPEMRTTLKGRLGDAVVIMAGYDDYPSIADDIDLIVEEAEAQGVTRVFWLNYRTTSAYSYGVYYRQHNQALEAAKVRHPNLVVLDWNAYTKQQSATTQAAWFERDGIHMRRAGALALANWLKRNIDASVVNRCNDRVATTGSTPSASPVAAPPSALQRLVSMPVTRAYDSANTGRRVGAGRVVRVDVTGKVPAGTESVAVTLGAVDPCDNGTLTAYASEGTDCGAPPATTSLAFHSGRTSAGPAVVPLVNGAFCVRTTAATDLNVFLTGTFDDSSGSWFHALTPTRWVDTRGNAAQQPVVGLIPPSGERAIQVGGVGSVPPDATAVWVNVTILGPSRTTRALLFPGNCTTLAPNAYTATAQASRVTATAGIVPLSDGWMCLKMSSAGTAHVVIDVWGWFDGDATNGGVFRSLAPQRLATPTSLAANTTTPVGTPSNNPWPLLTITSINGAGGNVALRPCDATPPALHYPVFDESVTGTGAVRAGGGGVCIRSSVPSGVTVDLTGEFVIPVG